MALSTARLHNKVVLVTGASGGIGAATARVFARAGANVVLAARRVDSLKQVEADCATENAAGGSGHGGHYASLALDMRQRAQLDALPDALPEWARNVDVLGTRLLTSEQRWPCARRRARRRYLARRCGRDARD